jgi:Uma2 family endonuclease
MSIVEAEVKSLPTHLDLPETDGKPVENLYQPAQSMLLTGSVTPLLDRQHPDGNYLVAGDTGIYWKITSEPLQGCKCPDWFYVPGVPRLLDGTYRRSYVLWQEHVHPLLVVEYVSGDGSEELDGTPEKGKFWVYEQVIQASYYAVHDPDRASLQVFELVEGRYRRMDATAEDRYAIVGMELELGLWRGVYQGYPAAWLRAWDANGKLLPTPEEIAEQERSRAAKLAAKLRELGVDPDRIQ